MRTLRLERELRRFVMRFAREQGWLAYHGRTSKHLSGKWATVIEGDAGFPDLVLCRPPRLLFVELKSEHGRLKTQQRQWLNALLGTGVEVYVWRFKDWESGAVQRVLE